nr:transposase (putative), gypsy type [Tanacetum cinerariifolium]
MVVSIEDVLIEKIIHHEVRRNNTIGEVRNMIKRWKTLRLKAGSACDRDLRMLVPFRGCLLVRESAFIRLAGPRAYYNNMDRAQGPDITRLRFRCLTVLLSCFAAACLSVAFHFIGSCFGSYIRVDASGVTSLLLHRGLGPNLCILFIMGSITDIRSVLTQRALSIFCEACHIPNEVNSQLPNPNQTIHEMPSGKIGVYTSKGVPKDPFPKSFEFNAKHFANLVTLSAPFHKYPEQFLCLVGISHYYTLDEDAYLEFLGDNDERMDFLAFIRTADPTKVRVAESELKASVDKLFDEGASGDGGDADVRPFAVTIDTIVEEVASLQPRHQRKRKTVVADAGGPSHPPKKLREDYGALGGASTTGKSMFAIQSLFTGAVLDAEARGEPIPTLPFVTSSMSATPEREDKSPVDSVPGLNLRIIGAPQRFVISSDSSHHSGANIVEAEVDSVVGSSAPTIATVTTVTAMIDTDATATRAPVMPSLFGVGSSSTGRTDSVRGGFFDVFGSDFLIGGIRTVVDPDSDLQKVYVPRYSATNVFWLDDSRICREMLDEFAPPKFFASVRRMDHDQLFIEFNVGAARQISLNAEDGEIESLKAQLLLKEAEAAEAICIQADVFKFESAEQSLRSEVGVLKDRIAALEREMNELDVKVTDLSASVKVREHKVADLDAQVTAVKLQNDNLVGQVHELEVSSVGLQEKIAAYEGFVSQLEKFQDEKLEEVNEKFDKLCADFVDMALHLEEKFYLHLLTTISERWWLLTYGMGLAVAKCLNSTEYLSALRAAISKAVEKGMQKGLSGGITHGAEGRKLADVAAYNLSAKADYLSALQHLQNVNFPLIAKLKSNKDASVDTIMNLLCLDDVLAERLGLTESQPHVNQLMVPIHHSPDQRVVGASALSLSLEVSHSRVKKMRENIANHVLALRGVFVPLSEPLSAVALEGMEGTSSSTHDAASTLSITFVFASTIPPISTNDYEVAHADGQGGASVGDETATVDDINLFVSNTELNILE